MTDYVRPEQFPKGLMGEDITKILQDKFGVKSGYSIQELELAVKVKVAELCGERNIEDLGQPFPRFAIMDQGGNPVGGDFLYFDFKFPEPVEIDNTVYLTGLDIDTL